MATRTLPQEALLPEAAEAFHLEEVTAGTLHGEEAASHQEEAVLPEGAAAAVHQGEEAAFLRAEAVLPVVAAAMVLLEEEEAAQEEEEEAHQALQAHQGLRGEEVQEEGFRLEALGVQVRRDRQQTPSHSTHM